MNYSLTEQATGETWINGEPVYQITLVNDGDAGDITWSEPTYTIIGVENICGLTTGELFTDSGTGGIFLQGAGLWFVVGDGPYTLKYTTIKYIKSGL